uniref:Uncharacterized protein n=1 Tax=Timema bartmani TaxID=61472 RepID=A0A7R9EQT3_9NEOP|nr:unnamed protein product [Timema bartmani]
MNNVRPKLALREDQRRNTVACEEMLQAQMYLYHLGAPLTAVWPSLVHTPSLPRHPRLACVQSLRLPAQHKCRTSRLRLQAVFGRIVGKENKLLEEIIGRKFDMLCVCETKWKVKHVLMTNDGSLGKVVIRPIAFKPVTGSMSPSTRFSNTGERYGSTPILTRPGSHLTLYGSSSDLRHHTGSACNYSLDRKFLSTSPPLAMASLTSLPVTSSGGSRKLGGYDGTENVRESPASTASMRTRNHVNSTKSSASFRPLSGVGHLNLTPSPSDSGVAELEAALRDRDSELTYLRQTMEHNEQVIFRVYQEKERVWERELRRLKAVHENRLRAGAQKTLRLEQMLMMQTYQLQQDKKRLREEADRASREATELRQEVELLRGRLEETEWGLCQKTGEMSLLKAQLKDSQGEQTTKGHELLQLKTQIRDLKTDMDRQQEETQRSELDHARLTRDLQEATTILSKLRADKDVEICRLEELLEETREQLEDATREKTITCDALVLKLRHELKELENRQCSCDCKKNRHPVDNKEVDQLQAEVQRLKAELSRGGTEKCDESSKWGSFKEEVQRLGQELREEREGFDRERVVWAQEKEKVLRYQRQLQLNYVQMFRRTKTLETEVESLTLELELGSKTGRKKPLPAIEMGHTIEL